MDDEKFMAWCLERGYRFNFDEDTKSHYVTMSLEDMKDFYLDVEEYERGREE